MTNLSALAADIELCDLGLALTRGKLRKRYASHKAACLAEIERIAPLDVDIAALSVDELAAELGI